MPACAAAPGRSPPRRPCRRPAAPHPPLCQSPCGNTAVAPARAHSPCLQTLKPKSDDEEHTGLLGPVLRAAVGQVLTVVLRNNLDYPVNLQPAGLQAYLPAGSAAAANAAAALSPAAQPNATVTYRFLVPAAAGPSPAEPSAKLWLYRCAWRPNGRRARSRLGRNRAEEQPRGRACCVCCASCAGPPAQHFATHPSIHRILHPSIHPTSASGCLLAGPPLTLCPTPMPAWLALCSSGERLLLSLPAWLLRTLAASPAAAAPPPRRCVASQLACLHAAAVQQHPRGEHRRRGLWPGARHHHRAAGAWVLRGLAAGTACGPPAGWVSAAGWAQVALA